jgi:hypothetical protein
MSRAVPSTPLMADTQTSEAGLRPEFRPSPCKCFSRALLLTKINVPTDESVLDSLYRQSAGST